MTRKYYLVAGWDTGKEAIFLAETGKGDHLFTAKLAAERVKARLTRAHGRHYQVLEVDSEEPVERQPRRTSWTASGIIGWGKDEKRRDR